MYKIHIIDMKLFSLQETIKIRETNNDLSREPIALSKKHNCYVSVHAKEKRQFFLLFLVFEKNPII